MLCYRLVRLWQDFKASAFNLSLFLHFQRKMESSARVADKGWVCYSPFELGCREALFSAVFKEFYFGSALYNTSQNATQRVCQPSTPILNWSICDLFPNKGNTIYKLLLLCCCYRYSCCAGIYSRSTMSLPSHGPDCITRIGGCLNICIIKVPFNNSSIYYWKHWYR